MHVPTKLRKSIIGGNCPPAPPPTPSGYDSDVQRLMNFESLTLEPYAYWRCSSFFLGGGGALKSKEKTHFFIFIFP